ncbi:MAG: hypothetical protein LBQ54_11020, partial [Planctomycetaceae bacterium]|nr:hypothetical protein [Planctomycetaceae bacterium]
MRSFTSLTRCPLFSLLMLFGAVGFLAERPSGILAVEFSEFQTPPDSARPAVYWFIMDGNLTKEGITADFEAMKQQGIGGLILMEVNVGVPRGKVEFMSETWQEHFVHIVRETERLG